MERIFLISFFTCLISFMGQAQEKKQPKAWEVTFKNHYEALPNASQEVLEKIEGLQQTLNRSKLKVLISDGLYRFTSPSGTKENELFSLIVNRRDSVVFRFNGKAFVRMSFASYLKTLEKIRNSESILNKKNYPVEKKILGFPVKKITYELTSKSNFVEKLKVEAWYSEKLPDWNLEKDLPGFVLKSGTRIVSFTDKAKQEDDFSAKFKNVQLIKKAIDIKEVTLSESDYYPPEGAKIIGASEIEPKPLSVRDSIFNILDDIKNGKYMKEGAVFNYGFARISSDSHTYYINNKGKKYGFDQIVGALHPIDTILPIGSHGEVVKSDSIVHLIVIKNDKYGLVSENGEWLISPKYDHIRKTRRRLTVINNLKKGYFSTWGEVIVPPEFDMIEYLTGTHYGVFKNGNWGVYSVKQQKLVTSLVYDDLDYGGCYVYLSKNGKWGVVNLEGEVLIPFEYEHPRATGMGAGNWVTTFKKDGKDVIINMNTQEVYSLKDYDAMGAFNDVLLLVKDGKCALVNINGKILNGGFVYESIEDPYMPYQNGPYIIVTKNGKKGVIRDDGSVVVPPKKYDELWLYGDYFVVGKNGKFGLLDSLTHKILPLKYDNVNGSIYLEFTTKSGEEIKLFELNNNELVGFFNPEKGVVVDPKFEDVDLVHSDSTNFYVEVEKKWGDEYDEVYLGLYSSSGKELMPPQYDDYYFISPHLTVVEKEDKHGLYDLKEKEEILPPKYGEIFAVGKRYFWIESYDEHKFIGIWDKKKKEFLSLPYSHISFSGEKGLLFVGDEEKTYLYNLKIRKIISKAYPNSRYSRGILEFEHGLAGVHESDKYGFINTQGEIVVPVEYDDYKRIEGGFIRLSKEVKDGPYRDIYVDSSGEKLTSDIYLRFDYGYYKVRVGKFLLIKDYDKQQEEVFYQLLDLEGNVVTPAQYDEIQYMANGKGFIVKRNGNFGLLDKNGNKIFPVVLDDVEVKGYVKSYPHFKKVKTEFPILCKLGEYWFYVNHSGEILPLVLKNKQ